MAADYLQRAALAEPSPVIPDDGRSSL